MPAGVPSPVDVYLESLQSADSRTTMRGCVDRLAQLLLGDDDATAEHIAWHTATAEHTTAIRAALVERYAPTTSRKMLAALAGVLRQCWRLGLLEYADYQRLIAWEPVRGEGLKGATAGRQVESGELRAMYESCAEDPSPARGARDAALLSILYGAGARRGEAVRIDLEHFDRGTGDLVLHGKGDKVRKTYCTNGGCEAINAWLDLRGDEPGPLLLAVNKGGRIDPGRRRMTTTAVYQIVRRRALAAAVKPLSPHDMRRTFVGDLLDAGADLATVRDLVGHASVSTTAMYDRRGEEAKKRTAGMLHVPYVAPSTSA
jgi:integrase